jgi:hypothetical protein
MKYHLLSAALIVAAIALETTSYGKAGSNLGATLFVAGVVCEFFFWIRVAKKARRQMVRMLASPTLVQIKQ